MKIAILTWLHNGNYGTLLQAYALQRFLRREGYDVSNINYKPSTIEKAKNLIKCHNSFSLFKEKFDGYLSKKQGQPELLCQRNKAFEQFLSKNFNLTKQYSKPNELTELSGKYDAYIARVDDFDCGIMISASHNPYYDNGIKLIDCYGEKMPEETLLLVEDYIDGKLHVFDQDWPELPFAHREHIGCTVDYVAGRNRYMGYLISLGIYSFKGVKVGLDCANGSSWNIAKSVFDALGADTYVINNQPNGLNINNNAGSTHIEGLQKFVVEKGLDVGFAYDGDADRCLCVDEKGNVITGDHILYIYGCYMKERGKLLTNTVVTTVMSNFGLYKAFDEQGIGYAKTAVGDKYVYEYMAKNGCRIGGEQSGHIIFSKYASTGDGILTSLKMMEVMLAKKKPMSELAAPLKIYPQVLENVRVTDKKAAQNDEAVQTAVKKVAEGLGDTGRILVRESGTEPVVRVMVEAPDHDTCQKYVSEVVNVIRDRGYSL